MISYSVVLITTLCQYVLRFPDFLSYLQMAKIAHDTNQTELRAIHPEPVNGFELL